MSSVQNSPTKHELQLNKLWQHFGHQRKHKQRLQRYNCIGLSEAAWFSHNESINHMKSVPYCSFVPNLYWTHIADSLVALHPCCSYMVIALHLWLGLKPPSYRARQIKLMLKIVSIHTDHVDARQLICIHRMSDVSLSCTQAIGLLITINGQNVRVSDSWMNMHTLLASRPKCGHVDATRSVWTGLKK